MKAARELMMDAPVIAAVKDDAGLYRALESDCQVIFLLYGSILNIAELVGKIHSQGKRCFVHIDLVEGFSNREIAVDALVRMCRPEGIISTRLPLIRRAQQLGLSTVLRAFLLDSMSLENLLQQLQRDRPDFVEILPGIIPAVIREIGAQTTIPLIAGGLIRSKQDVIHALQAGVIAVSTSCVEVWHM